MEASSVPVKEKKTVLILFRSFQTLCGQGKRATTQTRTVHATELRLANLFVDETCVCCTQPCPRIVRNLRDLGAIGRKAVMIRACSWQDILMATPRVLV